MTLRLPNCELTPGRIPEAGAEWSDISPFAASFDGYAVTAPEWRSEVLADARRAWHADGSLPPSLTECRALLFLEMRELHFTWTDNGPEDMPFVRALVEAIRSAVARRTTGQSPDAWPAQDKAMAAFDRLVRGYAAWGGHRFHGWTGYEDPLNYFGPVIRSERDCGLRFAMELEREWPSCVHMEFSISKATRADFDPAAEAAQRVDVAVTDLRGFTEDGTSQERYRTHQHEAFFEVKWLQKGWRGSSYEMDAKKRVEAVAADCEKLSRHAELGRCKVAGMLIVDDEDYFHEHAGGLPPCPRGVWRLVLGPELLRARGLLDMPQAGGD
ncbi:MAG: hypothetical protein U0R70_16380 [Solirubrobacteraceae bacterium]